MSISHIKAETTYGDIILVNKSTYTYERTWRDVIFLPFSKTVEVLFLLNLLVSIHVYIFIICFEPLIDPSGTFNICLYILEFTYLVHTCLLLAHHIMIDHRKRERYHPHSWIFIIVDIIAVLPLQAAYQFVQNFKWVSFYSEKYYYFTSLLKLVRIIRLIEKFKEYMKNPGLEAKLMILLFHFIFSTIVAHIGVTCYYKFCCLTCNYDNLFKYVDYIAFDDSSDSDWFLLLYTYVHLVLFHNYWGSLVSQTIREHIFTIGFLFVGIFLRYIFLIGNMTAFYIRALRFMFSYKQQLIWTNDLMQLLQFNKSLIDKVNEYYQTIWKEYNGITHLPEILKLFPVALQREILTDIYWDAIMHTHLYAGYDNSVRRQVCSLMTTEIRMPGEKIFSTGEIKYKMYYIVSGIVELYATENVGAPIMSFRSGTILGVISSTLPSISNGTFVCSTTCHLHVLDYTAMHKLYRVKPQVFMDLMESIKERIRFAKIKRLLLLNSKSNLNQSHIMWVKRQWRTIMAITDEQNEEHDEDLYNECYSSRFLDLLVLSNTTEWHKDIICIRDKCPFILQRDSGFRNFLHYLNLVVIALQFMITTKCIAFDREISHTIQPLLMLLDLFYFLDLYVQVITIPKNFVTRKPNDIMLFRARQMMFIFDVVATIPYDYFGGAFKIGKQTAACLRIPRFLKLYKLVLFFIDLEINCNIKNLYIIKFIKFMMLHVIFIISFVCFLYIFICFDGNCDDSWLWWSRNVTDFIYDKTFDTSDYLDTFHHVISIYLGLNVSNSKEVDIFEIIIVTVCATLGYYVGIFCFIQLAAVVSLSEEFNHQFLLDMDILNEITDRKDLTHLKSKIINFANVQWNLNKNQTLQDIYTVMGQESYYLHSIVTKEYIMDSFRKTELFCDSNPRYLRQLAFNSSLLVIPEGHLIYESSHQIYHLYIIVEGSCEYRSLLPCDEDKHVVGVMGKNSCFPVVTVFEEVPPLVQVSSLTTVILLCIPYLLIRQLLKAFPRENKIMMNTVKIHKAQNEQILKRYAPNQEQKRNYNLTKVPTFEYRTDREKHSCKNTSFFYGFTNMEKFFRKLAFTTYDPNSRGYFFYEVFRSVCIIIEVLITLLNALSTVYACIITVCFLPMVGFWMLGLIDIYVRSHVQYYNDIGIKVTKLSKTFKHYVETSFGVDFLTTFPYQLLGIIGLFHSNPMRAYILLMGLIRSIALYRPVKLFIYIKNSVNPKYQIYFVLSLAIIVGMYFFVTTTHIFLIFTCDTKKNYFEVEEICWINMYTSLENFKETHLYLIMFYVVSSMNITSTYAVFTTKDNILQLIIVLYIFIMRLFFVTYILGGESHGNIQTAKHQDAIRDYLGFTSKKLLSNADKNEMLEHIGNYWKKSKGASPQNVFENFSPYMREEIFLSLYRQALEYNYLFFDGEESLYRLVVCYLDERYYKKGADIIRTNDVQDKIFIVASGHVNVYIADIYMATLRTGGIFGCFNPRGKSRQTVRVTASLHVKLLVIKTSMLYDIGGLYPLVRARMYNIFIAMKEYCNNEHYDRIINFDQQSASLTRSKSHTTRGEGWNHLNWFFETVHERNKVYKMWNYITNVHIVSISSLYCLFVLVVDIRIKLLWLWILLDVYFLGQIYIRSHLGYTDLESGVTVTLFEPVVSRYLKSLNFYVDLVSIVPVYFIPFMISIENQNLFIMNKFIRVCNLYTYYNYYIVRKNVPRHLKWTFLIYNTLFILQVVFVVWYSVATYSKEVKTAATYLRVISVFTSAGLMEPEFINEIQILINLIIIYVTQGLLIYTLIVTSRLLLDYNYTVAKFKISVHSLMNFCKNEYLSKPLSEKVFTYVTYLFRYHNGRQDPILFQSVPAYILQNHKSALYGKFIETLQPFCLTHVDFMRQLYEHVEVSIYLPGDLIVEVGDCNSTMYFIEEGEVIAIEEVNGHLGCEIISGGMFGLRQGLTSLEYTKTYRAKTRCSIISVCRHNWEYLLEYFPATREVLDTEIELAKTPELSIYEEEREEEEEEEEESSNDVSVGSRTASYVSVASSQSSKK